MTSRPVVDWRQVRVKVGDWSCPIHGVIVPAAGLVPHCAGDVDGRTCMRIAWRAEAPGRHVQARPATCAAGHALGAGTVLSPWRSCPCTPAGGHQVWLCQVCGDEQQWPPHDPAAVWPR